MGVSLSLDDFGTKHSSLSHLDTLPVDELKIDRSFIAELTRHQRTALIVSSTLQLAERLRSEPAALPARGGAPLAGKSTTPGA